MLNFVYLVYFIKYIFINDITKHILLDFFLFNIFYQILFIKFIFFKIKYTNKILLIKVSYLITSINQNLVTMVC